jgi:hypothetical protein
MCSSRRSGAAIVRMRGLIIVSAAGGGVFRPLGTTSELSASALAFARARLKEEEQQREQQGYCRGGDKGLDYRVDWAYRGAFFGRSAQASCRRASRSRVGVRVGVGASGRCCCCFSTCACARARVSNEKEMVEMRLLIAVLCLDARGREGCCGFGEEEE